MTVREDAHIFGKTHAISHEDPAFGVHIDTAIEKDLFAYFNVLTEIEPDVLFANEQELRALTGEPAGGEETLRAASRFAPNVVMKTGPRGCIVLDGDRVFESPAYPAQPLDTTGAGDAFAGGYLFGCIQKQSVDICARVANRLAAGIVTVDGCNYDALDPGEIATTFAEFD